MVFQHLYKRSISQIAREAVARSLHESPTEARKVGHGVRDVDRDSCANRYIVQGALNLGAVFRGMREATRCLRDGGNVIKIDVKQKKWGFAAGLKVTGENGFVFSDTGLYPGKADRTYTLSARPSSAYYVWVYCRDECGNGDYMLSLTNVVW